WVDIEGVLQSLGHGVGLGEVTDTEGRDDRSDCEEPGEELAQPALDAVFQVALRAAGDVALLIRGAETNAQEGLGVLGRNADQAGNPHPEQRAGATDGQCGSNTDDIAHTHGRSQRCSQGLVLRDITLASFVVAVQEPVTESDAELAELDATQADREHQTGTEEEWDE